MENKPRIYMVISTFHPIVGGAEQQVLAQCRSLRERGYAATIVTFRHNRKWLGREVIEGVPIIRIAGIPLGGREKLPRLLQRLLYAIALVIMGWTLWRCRQHYDILHLHQFSFIDRTTLPVALVCRLTGTPMVIVVHSLSLSQQANAGKKVSLVAGPLDTTALRLQVDALTGNADGDLADLKHLEKPSVRFTCFLLQRIHAVMILISSRMQGYLAASNFHLPATQLIPNGVDIIHFQPKYADTSSINECARVVICVSRLSYEKGIDVLLQAWLRVKEQFRQARLIIVGNGPFQSQLECMVQVLGIADSVEFAGLQSDIPAQLHRAGIAVLPSRYEGMPVALLEAMACGLPCVATRVSGSEDIIQHGINGLLIEPEDYQGMAQALLTLLRDPSLAQEYGYAARATIERHYSLEHITDMYINLYQKITSQPLPENNKSPGIDQHLKSIL